MRDNTASNTPEWLVLDGLISTDGQFSLLSGRIQASIRQDTAKQASPSKQHSVLLLDEGGDILLETAAMIRSPTICNELAPTHQRLSATLPLPPGVTSLAIRRQGREIYRSRIKQAPKLKVTWPKGRLQRGKRHNLELTLSEPGNADEALLILAIHWGDDRYRIIGVSDPVNKLSFDPAKLPGDKSCRLSITYHDGFRSTTAFSPRLSLTPLPPNLRMLKPREGTSFVAGAPISLVAEVEDPQGDRGLSSTLRWSLDGKSAGSGSQALLTDLKEGEYTLRLTLEGYKQPTMERKIKIVPAPTLQE